MADRIPHPKVAAVQAVLLAFEAGTMPTDQVVTELERLHDEARQAIGASVVDIQTPWIRRSTGQALTIIRKQRASR